MDAAYSLFQVAGWGILAGSALLLGAWSGFSMSIRQRTIAGIIAFASGVLISTVTFELMGTSSKMGGVVPAISGFAIGAAIFTAANYWLSFYGAKHRKRSHLTKSLDNEDTFQHGAAIAIGALIDGIPESLIIGMSLWMGSTISKVTLLAIFISNFPEGLSSAVGMKQAGKSSYYVLLIWGAITLTNGVGAMVGFQFAKSISPVSLAVILAVGAGAILAMIVDTLLPEAFEETHDFTGMITVIGFICGFYLSQINL